VGLTRSPRPAARTAVCDLARRHRGGDPSRRLDRQHHAHPHDPQARRPAGLQARPDGCSALHDAIPSSLEPGRHPAGFTVRCSKVLGPRRFLSGFLRGCLRDLHWNVASNLANAQGPSSSSRHGCATGLRPGPRCKRSLAGPTGRSCCARDVELTQTYTGPPPATGHDMTR